MGLEQIDRLPASVKSHEAAGVLRMPPPTTDGSAFSHESDADASESESGLVVVPPTSYRREDVEQAVYEANVLADTFPDRRIAFSMDRDTERVVVQVVDNQTGEVVRQVPPQEFLDLVANVQQLVGLFFDGLA